MVLVGLHAFTSIFTYLRVVFTFCAHAGVVFIQTVAVFVTLALHRTVMADVPKVTETDVQLYTLSVLTSLMTHWLTGTEAEKKRVHIHIYTHMYT